MWKIAATLCAGLILTSCSTPPKNSSLYQDPRYCQQLRSDINSNSVPGRNAKVTAISKATWVRQYQQYDCPN